MKNKPSGHNSNRVHRYPWLYNHREILIIMLIFIIIVSTYSYLGYRVPILDEGVYVGMGKSMFSNGISGFWERFRPLGMPFIAGIGWKLGFDPYLFSKMIAILFGAASILFVYLIAEKIFDKRVALIASILFSITPLFMYYSEYVLTEIPSMFFILAGIYLILCDRYFIAGLMGGLGFIFKFTQGIFLVAMALFLIISLFKKHDDYKTKKDNKFINRFKNFLKKGILLFLGFLLAITPYIIYNYVMYHQYTRTLYDATIEPIVSATIFQNNVYQNLAVVTIGERIYGWFYYLINMFANKSFICLLYLFFFASVYLFFRERLYRYKEHLLLMLIFATYLIYFTSIPYKQERFVYFLIPIAAIYTSYALVEIHKWTIIKDKKTRKNTYVIIFIAIVSSFALISIGIDASFYTWKHSTKPAYVTQYYEYFKDNNITGTIATGDMVLAIYTDDKLTNMFELRADVEGKGSRNISSIFHADYTYPCLDDACLADKKIFFDEIAQQYTLVKSGPCYYSGNCYIYVKK
jgi:hypothetical protein